jgi:RNA polymerase sigma-70 factor (ECF subfamily)
MSDSFELARSGFGAPSEQTLEMPNLYKGGPKLGYNRAPFQTAMSDSKPPPPAASQARREPSPEPGRPVGYADRLSTSSAELVGRARRGDDAAVSRLIDRHLPSLRRWARGRLSPWMRRVMDTGDLVQNALFQTFRRLDSFEARGERALGAYLRQAVLNQIRDQHRRFAVRGFTDEVADDLADPGPSPFDEASAQQTRDRYLAALDTLRESDRELIVAHVECGYSHEQLGCMTGRTANAARVALRRALERLGDEMGRRS